MNTESDPIYRARSISTVQEAIDEARSWARLADESWHDGRYSTIKTKIEFADMYIRLAQAMAAAEALSVIDNQTVALRTLGKQAKALQTALQTEIAP